ncbi:chemotaxis protein CheX [Ruficoccus amylovorans]|uniref:Chemotaxis protein CheX n=1 Tax=Ruficoccus amylovorans TaxID=1804625 RepID=A0A842HFK6_9BACT|nr:chemotaxis protein CheX [Ruficoccus amylovorans]MBC2595000.1 chemotaxis protein CheX [Ruficoccus amylovorans]
MIEAPANLSHDIIQDIVVESIQNVFSTMVSIKPDFEACAREPEEADAVSPLAQIEEGVVVGNVGFVGDVTGMVYLIMPDSMAALISHRMLGLPLEDLSEDHEMINDVIGELSNMSAGTIKNQFDSFNYSCRLTIPSIIRGKYFIVEAAKATLRHFYRFRCMDKFICLELLMRTTPEERQKPAS